MQVARKTTKVRDDDLAGLDRIGELTNRSTRTDVISYLVSAELERLGAVNGHGRGRRRGTTRRCQSA